MVVEGKYEALLVMTLWEARSTLRHTDFSWMTSGESLQSWSNRAKERHVWKHTG